MIPGQIGFGKPGTNSASAVIPKVHRNWRNRTDEYPMPETAVEQIIAESRNNWTESSREERLYKAKQPEFRKINEANMKPLDHPQRKTSIFLDPSSGPVLPPKTDVEYINTWEKESKMSLQDREDMRGVNVRAWEDAEKQIDRNFNEKEVRKKYDYELDVIDGAEHFAKMHQMFEEMMRFLQKFGILLVVGVPSCVPDFTRKCMQFTESLAFGIKVDTAGGVSVLVCVGVCLYMFIFVKLLWNHVTYSAALHTDNRVVFNVPGVKSFGWFVKGMSRLLGVKLHPDYIPCREYWEYWFIERWGYYYLNQRHRNYAIQEDKDVMLHEQYQKGTLLVKRSIVWADVDVVDPTTKKVLYKGWMLCNAPRERGIARSYLMEGKPLQLGRSVMLMEQPMGAGTQIVNQLLMVENPNKPNYVGPKDWVRFWGYMEFRDKWLDADKELSETMGPGKGEICMVTGTRGVTNKLTNEETVQIINLKSHKRCWVTKDKVMPRRMLTSGHLTGFYWRDWYNKKGQVVWYNLRYIFTLAACVGFAALLYLQDDGTVVSMGNTYKDWAGITLMFSGVVGFIAIFEIGRMIFLRRVFFGFHTMDGRLTEFYQRKLGAAGFNKSGAGLRPEYEASKKFWTVAPVMEMLGTLTILMALHMPMVKKCCEMLVERAEVELDNGNDFVEHKITWNDKWSEFMLGLGAAFGLSFLFILVLFRLSRTTQVLYGRETRSDYAATMVDEFRHDSVFYRETMILESSLFVLIASLTVNERQLMYLSFFALFMLLAQIYLRPFNEMSLNINLWLEKASTLVVVFCGWMRLYYDMWPDLMEWAPFGVIAIYVLNTFYLMDFPKVFRSYRQFKRENLPKLQVAQFTKKNRMKFKKIHKWNHIHMENLSMDQRAWIVMYHMPTIVKYWSVFDMGPGANGEFLAKMRGNSINHEFIDQKEAGGGGLKILRVWDVPGVFQMPAGLEKARFLEDVAFGQCANMRGPMLDFSIKHFPKLTRVNLDETRLYDPIYASDLHEGHGDRFECIVFDQPAPYWDEVPDVKTFRNGEGCKFLARGCKFMVTKLKLLDWVKEDYAMQFYTMHKHPIWEVEQQAGWLNGRYVDLFKDVKKYNKDKTNTNDEANVMCVPFHLVQTLMPYRWPHITHFKWSYGDADEIAMRIEMIHRVGGSGMEAPRNMDAGA